MFSGLILKDKYFFYFILFFSRPAAGPLIRTTGERQPLGFLFHNLWMKMPSIVDGCYIHLYLNKGKILFRNILGWIMDSYFSSNKVVMYLREDWCLPPYLSVGTAVSKISSSFPNHRNSSIESENAASHFPQTEMGIALSLLFIMALLPEHVSDLPAELHKVISSGERGGFWLWDLLPLGSGGFHTLALATFSTSCISTSITCSWSPFSGHCRQARTRSWLVHWICYLTALSSLCSDHFLPGWQFRIVLSN